LIPHPTVTTKNVAMNVESAKLSVYIFVIEVFIPKGGSDSVLFVFKAVPDGMPESRPPKKESCLQRSFYRSGQTITDPPPQRFAEITERALNGPEIILRLILRCDMISDIAAN
jgi:hypothetical protein